jgi:hypothetical protein
VFVTFPDEQLILDGHHAKTSLPFLHLMISRRAARRLIVLHPKQNIESELKWQTIHFVHQILSIEMYQQHKDAVRQVKG